MYFVCMHIYIYIYGRPHRIPKTNFIAQPYPMAQHCSRAPHYSRAPPYSRAGEQGDATYQYVYICISEYIPNWLFPGR